MASSGSDESDTTESSGPDVETMEDTGEGDARSVTPVVEESDPEAFSGEDSDVGNKKKKRSTPKVKQARKGKKKADQDEEEEDQEEQPKRKRTTR